jgi:hypothetical protein
LELERELAKRDLRDAEEQAEKCAAAFAVAHMRTERRRFLDFTHRPYLLPILRDDRPNHVCVACAQSGKTMTYKAKVWWRLIYPGGKSRTAIYTFPTQSDVEEFSAARAKAMIEASPLLSEQIAGLNNVALKQFNNGSTIYYRGTFTQRAAISVPADILCHDELDKSQPDTLQMYSDRLRASDDPRTYLFSTPTIPHYGISAAWERSDQQEWFFACASCGEWQCFAPMSREHSWREHLDLEDGLFHCMFCQEPLTREAIEDGEWEAQQPESDVAGYHITGIMPPETSGRRLAREHEKAKFEELFVQGHIGVPEISGKDEITGEAVVFGDWVNTLKSEGRNFAGLDQGKKLDLVVGDGQGRIIGVHRCDDWAQVESAMRTLNIRMLVADSQPDARPVQRLVGLFPGRVLLADYSLNTVDKDPYEKVVQEPRVRIHRTTALDWTRDQILMGPDGGDVWPAMSLAEETELKAHLTASVRQLTEDKHGQAVAQWVETGPDHLRHAHTYYTVAAALAGGRSMWQSHLRPSKPPAPKPGEVPLPPEAQPKAAQVPVQSYHAARRAEREGGIVTVDAHGNEVQLGRRGRRRSGPLLPPTGA